MDSQKKYIYIIIMTQDTVELWILVLGMRDQRGKDHKINNNNIQQNKIKIMIIITTISVPRIKVNHFSF